MSEDEAARRDVPSCPATALYVYCVAPNAPGARPEVAATGLDGSPVRIVARDGICAWVHSCGPEPYRSERPVAIEEWVLAHHRVVQGAWQIEHNALPLGFNTIVVGTPGTSAEENLDAWLGSEYDSLVAKLQRLEGKAEFEIQLLWDPALIAAQLAEEQRDTLRLPEEAHTTSRGLAYMYRQRLERTLKAAMEARAIEEFKALYARAGKLADRVQVETPKRVAAGRQTIADLTCLVAIEKQPELEALAAEAGDRPGYFVRLVGPLPAYSFS